VTTPPIRSQYEDFMRHVQTHGVAKTDRTGTGTTSVFGHQMRFDLNEGFPLVTTKKVHSRASSWNCCGSCVATATSSGCRNAAVTIWDEWARADGDLGPVYGVQWRSWPKPDGGHIDQIAQVVQQLKTNPDSAPHHRQRLERGLTWTRWRSCPATPSSSSTWPSRRLSCQLYQRSADIFLGVPFNIASYALLTHMLAQQCDLEVGDFIWTGGDCHIYSNHAEQVALQLAREPRPYPWLHIKRRPDSIFDYAYEDFEVQGYDPHPAIKARGGGLSHARHRLAGPWCRTRRKPRRGPGSHSRCRARVRDRWCAAVRRGPAAG
jgi:thymidylate synthase